MSAHHVVAERFSPEPREVSSARRFLRRALAAIEGGPDGDGLVYRLVLAANELATNAVMHARTEFTVRVLVDAHRVRVEVADGNTRLPRPCLTPADATSGRGLAIVDGTGLQWGVERHARGKTVWVQSPFSPQTPVASCGHAAHARRAESA